MNARVITRLLIWLAAFAVAAYLGVRHHVLAANLGVWLAAICTLAIYSILYRENVVFRFFEHVFIGLATGYGFYIVITQVLHPKWWTPFVEQGRWYFIFALLMGTMFYTVYSRRYSWMNRLAVGVFMGLGAGLGIVGFITELAPQMAASFKPLWTSRPPYVLVNNLLFFITLITVMSYFFFSFEQRHPAIRGSARLGRWLLMVAFGAIFGNTVMGRMSLLIDRLDFLLHDWLRVFGG
ncbi:MAG: hypothetical protein JSV65_14345 [Armatimonadota bacterium]|nr:MAG: hypothetical protein JSV65_14345 [Armatimonadota bacterium]